MSAIASASGLGGASARRFISIWLNRWFCRGAKIAYPGEGSQQYPLLIKALADAKLDVKDVQLFKTDGSQVATLLANKSVDAGITWDPHVSRALADGVGRVLVNSAEIMPIKNGHYVGDGTYVRDDFMMAHPEIVQDLVSVQVKAIDLILKDPERAIGADFLRLWRQAADMVDKILRGTKPADIPSEQPTKFELVVNLKTAKALGLTISGSFLAQADVIIE